jgi:hypothetical protein
MNILRPELRTRKQLIKDNKRLRERIHEIQCLADKREAKLKRRIVDLEIELSVVDGMEKIGGDFFWDIAECARRPLHLSVSSRRIIGARLLLSILKPGDRLEKYLGIDKGYGKFSKEEIEELIGED